MTGELSNRIFTKCLLPCCYTHWLHHGCVTHTPSHTSPFGTALGAHLHVCCTHLGCVQCFFSFHIFFFHDFFFNSFFFTQQFLFLQQINLCLRISFFPSQLGCEDFCFFNLGLKKMVLWEGFPKKISITIFGNLCGEWWTMHITGHY